MSFTETEIIASVSAWLWPAFRIAAFVTAAPVFGNRPVPSRVKVGIALVLTMVIAPTVPSVPAVDPVSLRGALITVQQVVIGLSLGFAIRLVFICLEIAGQQIAQLMGLGFASLVDPQNGIDVPVVSNFYIILGTLVFLALNGHLVVIEALANSFTTLPIDERGISAGGFWQLTTQAGWIFSSAILMVLPAVAALLTVNMAFGVMSRAAPQLNIFAVGFPITMFFGFVVMFLTLSNVMSMLTGLFEQSFAVFDSLSAPR